MPDPTIAISIAAVAHTVAQGAKAVGLTAGAEEFFRRVAGPLGDRTGEALANLKARREVNLVAMVNRAAELSAESPAEPREVPLRLLAPILEHASVEDDPSMQARWAALLAHAACEGDATPPLFPNILAQLTPLAALVLEFLEGVGDARDWPSPTRALDRFGVTEGEIAAHLGVNYDHALELSVSLVHALGLLEREPSVRKGLVAPVLTGRTQLRLTAVGSAFVRACRLDE